MEIVVGNRYKRGDFEVLVVDLTPKAVVYRVKSNRSKTGWTKAKQAELKSDFIKDFNEVHQDPQ